MGGLQLLFLGVIGEYLGRAYVEAKRRPHFLIKEASGPQEVPVAVNFGPCGGKGTVPSDLLAGGRRIPSDGGR